MKSKFVCVGVDPGVTNGCLAFVGTAGCVTFVDIPSHQEHGRRYTDGVALQHAMVSMSLLLSRPNVRALIEKPRGFANTNSAMQLAHCWGTTEGIFACIGVPWDTVEPDAWQRELGLIKKKKRDHINLAIELYPSVADRVHVLRHDGRADSLLIAHTLRERLRVDGDLLWLL